MLSTEQSRRSPPKSGQGHVPGAKSVEYVPAEDYFFFDKMPRRVRAALRESPYDFSARQIWDVYYQVLPQVFSENDAWDAVLTMLPLNVAKLRQAEKEMYREILSQGIQLK